MQIPSSNKLYNFHSYVARAGGQVGGDDSVQVYKKGGTPYVYSYGGDPYTDEHDEPIASFNISEFPDCCAILLAHNFDFLDLPPGGRASVLKSLPDIAKWLGYTFVLFADVPPDRGCLNKIAGFTNSRTKHHVTLHGALVPKEKK